MSEDADLFASIATGYARARPPVHPRIVDRVRGHLGIAEPRPRALDVGCGSGLSTQALQPIARQRLGLDPAGAMVRLGAEVAPGARFAVAAAERLPVRAGSIDLISAAGSLNYADLERFFDEAARVLVPRGVLVVYDFTTGCRLRNSPALETWFDALVARHPWPRDSARRELDPEVLGAEAGPLALTAGERFEIGLELDPTFYLEYIMTEANVAHAVRTGTPPAEIREWCDESLTPIFGGSPREVVFEGYVAYLEPRA